MFDYYYRHLLRRVLGFLEKRVLLHKLDPDIVEWWQGEKAVIEKERGEARL